MPSSLNTQAGLGPRTPRQTARGSFPAVTGFRGALPFPTVPLPHLQSVTVHRFPVNTFSIHLSSRPPWLPLGPGHHHFSPGPCTSLLHTSLLAGSHPSVHKKTPEYPAPNPIHSYV